MDAARDHSELQQNLADLREQCLARISLFVGALGYGSFVWLSSMKEGSRPIPAGAWAAAGLLALGASTSYPLRQRYLLLATHLLVWPVFSAALAMLIAYPAPGTVYLLILPITFASVLLDAPAFLGLSTLATASAVALGLPRLGSPLPLAGVPLPARTGIIVAHVFSSGLAAPASVVVLATASLWLSSHSLRTALLWVWNGYERARRNGDIAQDRQAELKRALKALDEATYRLERANYMLTLARDQAEEARRLKQQFAQTISHELRTPLNLIVGFTELMAQSPEYYGKPLAPAYLRDLGIVYRNACHLQTLVNDVLDLARIEAAQMSLVPEEVDPCALAQEAVNTARSLVEARGLELHTAIEPGLPSLWVDPTRIRQVLFNLLSNASRFTEHGSVTVSARRDGDGVLFAVADTGPGIAPDDLPRIFEEFQQLDGGACRQHGGAGLGLAVSRRFVELHGGRIWAESRLGEGSTFIFRLPARRPQLDLAPARGAPQPSQTVAPKGSEDPVLLAVTRSPSAAALLSRYVHGFRTLAVADLEAARRTAAQLAPQVVVVDQASAQLDQKALEDLARAWGLPRTPIIACPLPGEEPLRQALDVDGYLIKPVSRQALWDVLRRYGDSVDRVLVVDDDQGFVLFLSRILEDSPVRRYQVASAGTGQEALALLGDHPPDLLLLDLILPDIDGPQIIARVRANPSWQHIPIIVVSAQEETDSLASLPGSMAVAKVGGLRPGEVVQWVQHVADTAARLSPARADGGQPERLGHAVPKA